MVSKIKDWIIHRLGGYTKEEQLCRPIQFVRQEVPIRTIKAQVIMGRDHDGADPEIMLKRKIADAITSAVPSPITFQCESYTTSYGHNVYSATLKVCMPTEVDSDQHTL